MIPLAQKESSSPGVMYIRWGRTECDNGATVLYEGFVSGGSYWDHPGGMSSPICLPNNPTYVQTEECEERSEIYTTEYESNNQVFPGNTDQYDAVCVACLLIGLLSLCIYTFISFFFSFFFTFSFCHIMLFNNYDSSSIRSLASLFSYSFVKITIIFRYC